MVANPKVASGLAARGLRHCGEHDTIGGMTTPVEQERTQPEAVGEEIAAQDRPWQTVVWNDPVNLMSYVTYVFQKYFGYDKAKAEKLMLQVHREGKSAVSSGSREEMERDVQAMHEYGLWATMEKQ